MKTYVLMISSKFSKTHPRAGGPTYFKEKIITAVRGYKNDGGNFLKLHTIRGNYDLWAKRFEKINKGEACLSIREWTDKPYRSKQKEIINLTREDGIGLQSLRMTPLGWFINDCDSDFTSEDFAKNDGLTLKEFSYWFRDQISIDMEPMAVIHFTKHRY